MARGSRSVYAIISLLAGMLSTWQEFRRLRGAQSIASWNVYAAECISDSGYSIPHYVTYRWLVSHRVSVSHKCAL